MSPPRFPQNTTAPMAALRVVSEQQLIDAQALQRAPKETAKSGWISEGEAATRSRTDKLRWRSRMFPRT